MRRPSYYSGRGHREFVDKEPLNKLFKKLRKDYKFLARQNFMCCGSCAGYALSEEYGKLCDAGKFGTQGVVFYHKQDGAKLRESGGTYLAFGDITFYAGGDEPKYRTALSTEQVGKLIKEACEELNINYEWDGNPATRFWVDLTEPLRAPPPAHLGEGI